MIKNRNPKRDTRAGLERELNLMLEAAERAGIKQHCCETSGIKAGPNGRLDLNAIITTVQRVPDTVALLRITA